MVGVARFELTTPTSRTWCSTRLSYTPTLTRGRPFTPFYGARNAPRQAGGRSTIHVYPDAPHAFHADYRPSYRKAEAEDGWKRALAWFKQHGVA